jgi:hypothetical protein
MRGKGTGSAPEGQYPIGQVVDGSPELIAELVDRGWVERVNPMEDPQRTPVGIAHAVIRGDALTHPMDNLAAQNMQTFGVDPDSGSDPYAVAVTQDPEATEVPEAPAAVFTQTDDWGLDELGIDRKTLVGPSSPAGAAGGDEGQGNPAVQEGMVGEPTDVTGSETSGEGEVAKGSSSSSSSSSESSSDDGPTLEELRDQARRRGVPVSGTKDELKERLSKGR